MKMQPFRSLALALATAFTVTSVDAAILNDWTYDDTAGTGVNLATNAGPENAVFSGTTPGWQTDGNGLLVASTTSNYFRNADIANITTGQSWLRMEIDSWNFSDTNESEQLGFCFRTAANNNIALIKIIRMTDTQVRLQVQDDIGTTTIQSFSAAGFTNGLDVIVGVDVDSDRYEVHYRTGADDYMLGATGVVNAAHTLDLLRYQHQNDSSDAGEFWAIDRFTHATSFSDLAGPTIVASSNVTVSALVEIAFLSEAGSDYRLQSTTNLTSGSSWAGDGATITGNGAKLKAYGSTTTSGQRNYRISSPLP